MFEEARNYIVERGLKECRELLKDGKGPEGFYDGAVDGFDSCRRVLNVSTLAVRIRELEVQMNERRLDSATWGSTPSDGKALREWWYWRGYLVQLEFVWDRLSLVEPITHDAPGTGPVLSARAVMDMIGEVLPHVLETCCPGAPSHAVKASAAAVKDMVELTRHILPAENAGKRKGG